ncbi:MAG: Asp-tRNA(Asn)/Glu-tRNA(Gln) amidotransferase subunit GatC [Anaplasma sp.]
MDQIHVDRQALEKAAKLVRLRVPESEVEHYCRELSGVVTWFSVLSEVNTEGVSPVLHGALGELPMRDDVVDDGGIRDQILSHSEVGSEAGYFFVRKVLG